MESLDSDIRLKSISVLYNVYPLTRKLVFDAFDKKDINITRTQQIIILSLSLSSTLTMSQLAKRINTSNEQATRAVAQLVEKGFVRRSQNPSNRRVINISLTDEAKSFIEKTKENIKNDLVDVFSKISDEEMNDFYNALITVETIMKKVM